MRLPERGPIGANGLANSRDFLARGLVRRRGGARRSSPDSGAPLVPRPSTTRRERGRLARQLRAVRIRSSRVSTRINTVSFDHPDPSIFTVLTSPRRPAGQRRLRDLSAALDGGGEYLPSALVPPQRDERVHGVDPASTTPRRRLPARRRRLHNCMCAHGPETESVRQRDQSRVEAAEARGHHGVHVGEGSLVYRPTKWALQTHRCSRPSTWNAGRG